MTAAVGTWVQPAGVVADRYPANVTLPGGRSFRDARVVLTRPENGQPPLLLVYADHRPTPRMAAWVEWVPDRTVIPHGRAPWRVAAPDGSTVTVERGRGCGCGSPLRRWKPWAGYRLAEMPAEVQR